MDRYETYKKLMLDRQFWHKTLGIISCKIIRERPEYHREWEILVDLLGDPKTQSLIQTQGWRLVFTGGTFDCLPNSIKESPQLKDSLFGLAPSALGVIQLANLVVYGHLFSVAFFNHMEDLYADSPQNLCLRRICNSYNTPLLEDASSILYFFDKWIGGLEISPPDRSYPKDMIGEYYGSGGKDDVPRFRAPSFQKEDSDPRPDRGDETLAIISHDGRKMAMLTFCLSHMSEILSYQRVISTGTTGTRLREHFRVVLDSFGSELDRDVTEPWGWRGPNAESAEEFLRRKICPLRSGPKEIGRAHV